MGGCGTMIGVSLNTLEDTAYIIVNHAIIRSWPSGLALLDHVIASLLGKDACSFLAFDGAHALTQTEAFTASSLTKECLVLNSSSVNHGAYIGGCNTFSFKNCSMPLHPILLHVMADLTRLSMVGTQ